MARVRVVDGQFEADEQLYRRVSRAALGRKGSAFYVKVGAIRLNNCDVSCFRQKYLKNDTLDEIVQGVDPIFSGVVSIAAGHFPMDVQVSTNRAFRWHVEDTPSQRNTAHASLRLSLAGRPWNRNLDLSDLDEGDVALIKQSVTDNMEIERWPRDGRQPTTAAPESLPPSPTSLPPRAPRKRRRRRR